jgi:predicted nucleic acid-binding protein
VRVYGETNFLLELAFDQAEARACKELLNLAETGLLRLVVPAFSIFEARQTMFRRHAKRRLMHSRVEAASSLAASTSAGITCSTNWGSPALHHFRT